MTTTRTNESVKERTGYLGGSDAAAILGLSPWATPYDIYLDKIGEGTPLEESEAMSWGNLLEEPVAKEFSKRTGLKVARVNANLRHKEQPFMGAHLDRRIVGERAILEVKTSGRRDGWGEDGSDDIPQQYLCQVLHYMAVTGAEMAYVAALLCGQELRIYKIPRVEALISTIEQQEAHFWTKHVEARVAPDITNASDAAKAWRAVQGKEVVATESLIGDLWTLHLNKEHSGLLKKERDEIELRIKAAMEDADTLVDATGKPLVTWKESTSKRVDTKALKANFPEMAEQCTTETVSRRFLVKKQKGEA